MFNGGINCCFVKSLFPFLGMMVFVVGISSCKSDRQVKLEKEIPGLWQSKGHKDSVYNWPGCTEFYHDGTWREHHQCTVGEGMYWFDEDTLFTSILNYTNYEDHDTAKRLVLKLEGDEMMVYRFRFEDTIYYHRVDESDRDNSCWPFDY